MTDGVRQPQTIHAPRHIDVGEDHLNIFSGFKQRDSLLSATSFDRTKPASSNRKTDVRRTKISSSTISTRGIDIYAPSRRFTALRKPLKANEA
jgi:hypothetical protein